MSAPSPATPDAVPGPAWSGVRVRSAAYAAVLVAVGGWACFHRLGEGMLVYDEGFFAVTTERMLRTGDYVVPYIDGTDKPHLNAAPLYNWLSCLTADRAGDGNLRYRGWSAAFGVGCALATLALGAVLFGPEVGLLAGLLLLVNREFLFDYGARQGAMNTGLAFFVTTAAVFYALTLRPARGRWPWVAVGVGLGAAVLVKPPVLGGFFFAAIAAHHLATRRDLAWRERVRGPALAAVAATLTALPWYAALCYRVGPESLERLFVYNAVKRAADANAYPHGQPAEPWWFYGKVSWDSSRGFRLAGPALVWAAWAALRRRPGWGVPLALGGGFALALTVAAEKHPWYLLPAYPLVAVAIAGLLLAGFGPVTRAGWRLVGVAGLAVAVFLVRADAREVRLTLRHPRPDYPPLLVHRAAADDLAAGHVRLVLYRFPRTDERVNHPLGFTPAERIYPYLLPYAVRAGSPAELDQLLADGRPTVVFVPPKAPDAECPPPGLTREPDVRFDVASAVWPYPLFAYNGAERAFRLREVLTGALVRPRPPATPATDTAPRTAGPRP